MSLQPTGTQPAHPNAAQAQALYALANIQNAAQAADARVQQATDGTFRRMQDALNQSEDNNRTVVERNAALTRENDNLNQRLRELTQARDAQVSALEEQNRALQRQLEGLQAKVARYEPGIQLLKEAINYRHQVGTVPRIFNSYSEQVATFVYMGQCCAVLDKAASLHL